MTPHAHNWHKRPADCGKEDPCAVCSCPAAGTRKGGTWHRATLDTEGFAYRFILRRPGRSGWEHKGIVARTSARNPARANRDLETFARQLFGFGDDTAAQPAARGEIPTPPEAETDNPPQPAARGEIPTPPEAETDDTAQPAANVSESSNPGQTTLDLMAPRGRSLQTRQEIFDDRNGHEAQAPHGCHLEKSLAGTLGNGLPYGRGPVGQDG